MRKRNYPSKLVSKCYAFVGNLKVKNIQGILDTLFVIIFVLDVHTPRAKKIRKRKRIKGNTFATNRMHFSSATSERKRINYSKVTWEEEAGETGRKGR